MQLLGLNTLPSPQQHQSSVAAGSGLLPEQMQTVITEQQDPLNGECCYIHYLIHVIFIVILMIIT